VVKVVGERVTARDADPETAAAPLDVVTRQQEAPVEEAVAEEAKKGYDLLIVGLEPAVEDGEFSRRIARVAEGFDGPIAIVSARGPHRDDPDRVERDILVPVTGTGFSRRGAEVAVALARASNAKVTALYFVGKSRKRSWRRRLGVGWMGGTGAAVLREVVRLGEQQGVTVRAVLRRRGTPEDAILRLVKGGRHDLVVMGVSPRPGETLFFGGIPDAVLERSDKSVVLVSS
jgi:nucleotide-binding universal stress UspA family protein